MPNYYQILELPFNASASEVKRAYREKAKACHPDISRSKAAKERFQELNRAYSTLSNAEKRRRYDFLLLYRKALIRRRTKGHRQRGRGTQGRWERGPKMRSNARSYRYYRADPPPLFKFGIYGTGVLFGISLFFSTAFSLITNGWPWISSLIFVPAVIVTYQGWNGIRQHRSAAGKHFLRGWGRLVNYVVPSKGAGREGREGPLY